MTLVFNEEQRLLKSTAHDFLASNAPVAQLRELRDSRDTVGYSTRLWREMAELGWAGIAVPEQFGGLEFGFAGLGAVLEETGRTLTASPLLSTAVLGASALLLGGNTEQKETILPGLAAGEVTVALALEESNHHDPLGVELTAVPVNGGFVLNGTKRFVVDGHSAAYLIVVARSAGAAGDAKGLSLFLVSSDTPGVDCIRTIMVDGRNAANIAFNDVALDRTALLGGVNDGWSILEPVLDRGRVALAAEMLGSCREALERTVAYLKEREQFGVKIGSFQALQHRAALMFIEMELCQSVVMQALSAVDESPEQLPLLASLAKARLNEAAELITSEAVQMHGGIGVTDEFEIGLFLKRARVVMQWLGDSGYHRDRYATLSGY